MQRRERLYRNVQPTAIKSTSGTQATFNLDGQEIGGRLQTGCLVEAESSINQSNANMIR